MYMFIIQNLPGFDKALSWMYCWSLSTGVRSQLSLTWIFQLDIWCWWVPLPLHHHVLTRASYILYLAHQNSVFWHLTRCPRPQGWDALWTKIQFYNCQIVGSSSCPVFKDMKTSRVKWDVWKLCCCGAVWFGNEVPTFYRYLVPQSSCHLRWLWY